MTQRTSTAWKESHSSSSLSISHLCCPTVLLSTPVSTSWPWTGPAVAQQCLSLARGVCTLTSLKIPEDRFRTRVSDRLPWKDLGQTSKGKGNKQRKCSSTTVHTSPLSHLHAQSEKGSLHKGRRKLNTQSGQEPAHTRASRKNKEESLRTQQFSMSQI